MIEKIVHTAKHAVKATVLMTSAVVRWPGFDAATEAVIGWDLSQEVVARRERGEVSGNVDPMPLT
jgi:hypothetical protein